MPIYEYRCKNCNKIIEVKQGIFDKPLSKCPKCTIGDLVKLISKSTFHLKGKGWYATDYKGK